MMKLIIHSQRAYPPFAATAEWGSWSWSWWVVDVEVERKTDMT